MQAILIKFLSATNTQGTRLKAIAYSGNRTVGRKYDIEPEDQARELALSFAKEVYIGIDKLTGFGMLANGDYVATIGV